MDTSWSCFRPSLGRSVARICQRCAEKPAPRTGMRMLTDRRRIVWPCRASKRPVSELAAQHAIDPTLADASSDEGRMPPLRSGAHPPGDIGASTKGKYGLASGGTGLEPSRSDRTSWTRGAASGETLQRPLHHRAWSSGGKAEAFAATGLESVHTSLG